MKKYFKVAFSVALVYFVMYFVIRYLLKSDFPLGEYIAISAFSILVTLVAAFFINKGIK